MATDIGWAINQLLDGRRVRREGWNGKGMWIALQEPDANSKMTLPYVFMKTAQAQLVPWLCSQTDLLATDWEDAYGDATEAQTETRTASART
jgi:Protein of unknown function (DUF2829)